MKKYLEILQHCSLFEDISPVDLLTMLDCLDAQVRRFEKRALLVVEGDEAVRIGIVLEGAVCIEQTDYFGSRTIVGRVGPGELFGESFACAGVSAMPLDVTAAEACTVLFVDRSRILRTCCNACAFHQQLIYNLMRTMARKNLAFHQRLSITAQRTTREKLLAYLALQAKQAGSSSFCIPFDRQQLADYLLVERSGLSAEISRLRAEGVLECRRNHFTLLEAPADAKPV